MTEVHIKLENTEHQNPVVSRGEVVAVLVHVQAHALMLEILGASAFIWGAQGRRDLRVALGQFPILGNIPLVDNNSAIRQRVLRGHR